MLIKIFQIGALALGLVGCATRSPRGAPTVHPSSPTAVGSSSPRPAPPTLRAPHRLETSRGVRGQLLRELRRWRGTPYRLGGTNRRGVDCSAFVQHVFREAFGVGLPRTTERQAAEGLWVEPGAWQPGDLVFFRPDGGYNHVGIFLGDGEFIHASKRQGVTVSPLGSYWNRVYWTSRRHPLPMGPTLRSAEDD